MPGPWRRSVHSHRTIDATCVSISTEMPGPWRLLVTQARANVLVRFQSQPRCQAPGDDSGALSWIAQSVPVSISTEMPGPWRRTKSDSTLARLLSFNLNRDARPLATQMMSQCHHAGYRGFNLNRDARPLATSMQAHSEHRYLDVSISTEMPGPWRLMHCHVKGRNLGSFNLNRDARPLATRTKEYSWINALNVSISTEMPGPWRPLQPYLDTCNYATCFNLKRDARPLATWLFQ